MFKDDNNRGEVIILYVWTNNEGEMSECKPIYGRVVEMKYVKKINHKLEVTYKMS